MRQRAVAGSGGGPAPEGIAVRGLRVQYGPVVALDNVDIRCPAGSIVGVIGPNGAGKSTLVNALANLRAPDSGAVSLLGRTYSSREDEAWIKSRTGFLLSADGLFEYLTGREFMEYLADAYGVRHATAQARIHELADLLELHPFLDRLVAEFSRGNQKKLAIAGALVHDPDLLVLDEPFESLDPLAVVRVRRRLRERADAGRAALLTSHILAALEPIIDEVVVLHRGAVVAAGTIAEVTRGLTDAEPGTRLEQLYETLIAPAVPEDNAK